MHYLGREGSEGIVTLMIAVLARGNVARGRNVSRLRS
jgi:hypothetical protein